jgi:hypothetical protein
MAEPAIGGLKSPFSCRRLNSLGKPWDNHAARAPIPLAAERLQLHFVTGETAPSFPAQSCPWPTARRSHHFGRRPVVDEMDDGAINITTITGGNKKFQLLPTVRPSLTRSGKAG